uniref:Uncharacterized protein n=1 Tax=Panagrolaimus sp. PS1159 TaxID=55785 RepID=A0AC35ERP3_9BILA
MANLFVATQKYENRYAYGLTLGCTFFFFELSEYEIFDRALDFYQSQYDLNRYINHNGDFCPVDMFNVRYISQNSTPYFEILELSTGTLHFIRITKKKIFFKQITPKRATSSPKSMTFGSWVFDKSSGWATHYGNLLIHSKPSVNPRSGRHEVRTFIRHKHDAFPGACIKLSFSKWHLFQIYPLVGDEAYDFENYVQHDVAIPPRVVPSEHENLEYYFYATIGVIGFGVITIFTGIGLSIWKLIKYVLLEKQRSEIEKFVVACYVEKLEKISKVPKEAEKPKRSKKKKKRYSPSESKSSYRHRRRHNRRRRSLSASESLSKIPHGSKIIPLPNEKDLFASDRKKAELKPAAVQEPRKDKTGRQPSKGPSQSVCSLKSVTQSLDNSLDWTGKGVRVSKRQVAYEQHKEDKSKDEEDAYKLGLNLSTYKRKKKRQQHGLQSNDDLESKKTEETQYPLSQASGMSSYTKPIAPTPPSAPSKTATATPVAPGITNSTLLRGDKTPAQDEARYQRAEKELQDRLESEKRKREQHAAKAATAAAAGGGGGAKPVGGGAKVQLANNNPYGSLSVPLDDVFAAEKKK